MAIKVTIENKQDDGWITDREPREKDGPCEIRTGYAGVYHGFFEKMVTFDHEYRILGWDDASAWKEAGWRPLPKGTRIVLEQE